MPRDISTEMLDALQQGQLFPALFFTATFATGPVYLWSGAGSLSWNGHTWVGIGTLGSITPVEDGTTLEARGITAHLSGIDPDFLADVVNEFVLGKPLQVYMGMFGIGDPTVLIADPVLIWSGRTDQPEIKISGETATISLASESRLIEMNVPVDRRYTDDDQQRDFPGDLGFSHVRAVQEVTIYWGKAPSSSTNI